MSSNLYTGVWSNKYSRQVFLSVILLLLIAFLSICLLQASIACVDQNGCLKDHCQAAHFSSDYQKIIVKAHNENYALGKCRKPLPVLKWTLSFLNFEINSKTLKIIFSS